MFAENPITKDVTLKDGRIFFKCLTCRNESSFPLEKIDLIVGVNVICSKCNNISHVPGRYKSVPTPAGLIITGGLKLPIELLSDWYFENPTIVSTIGKGIADYYTDYGFWAFCAKCNHKFMPSVLVSFVVHQSMSKRGSGGTLFMGNSAASKKDFDSLSSSRCMQCKSKELIVIALEITDFMCNIIEARRKQRSE